MSGQTFGDTEVEAGNSGRGHHSSRSAAKAKGTPQHNPQSPRMRRIRSAPHKTTSADRSRATSGDRSDAANSSNGGDGEGCEGEGGDFSSEYHHVALQLLDLMHTLHTRAAQIHDSWNEEAGTFQEWSVIFNMTQIQSC